MVVVRALAGFAGGNHVEGKASKVICIPFPVPESKPASPEAACSFKDSGNPQAAGSADRSGSCYDPPSPGWCQVKRALALS